MTDVATNPLLEGLQDVRLPDPCAMVIFGASGDLTKRKLLPALYSLAADHLLPPNFCVVGTSRTALTNETFRAQMREGVEAFARAKFDPAVWEPFAETLYYLPGQFEDPTDYEQLKTLLAELDARHGLQGNRLFYLATPPATFAVVGAGLAKAGLVQPVTPEAPFTRLVIEKPFGRDLASALALNRTLREGWDECQLYRIDHYLGKETVQNIMAFRFANKIFEPIWNNRYVEDVQITVGETIGTAGRGGYYETAGALRDMVQNHIFQLLTLTAMEPPVSMDADAIRDEKVKVLHALRPLTPHDVPLNAVRGQYVEGNVEGEAVPGYRSEGGVAPDSHTETYVALRVTIDNWRWAGVPFYIRTGKRLPKRISEIAITFRPVPLQLFKGSPIEQNVLVIRIQPDEGIALKVGSKMPGAAMKIDPVLMEFRYGTSFGAEPPEAYERLLLDALVGDSTLFTRSDEVEASWRWINRVLDVWTDAPPPAPYAAGTWGPPVAAQMLRRDHHIWRRL